MAATQNPIYEGCSKLQFDSHPKMWSKKQKVKKIFLKIDEPDLIPCNKKYITSLEYVKHERKKSFCIRVKS